MWSFRNAWTWRSETLVKFIDDYSRHVSLYPIEKKSEVLSKFKQLGYQIETEFQPRTVKALISENGGEYNSVEFRNFCGKRGIKRVMSCPYTP